MYDYCEQIGELMEDIVIRSITPNDFLGIQHIHRNSKDPWNNLEECTSWLNKRMERGFYIQVALVNNNIVGHGEWIESREGRDLFFYLGLLEVEEDYRNRGIGRRMIEEGIKYAKELGCNRVVTIPEHENNSIEFYKKCGFLVGRTIKKVVIPSFDYEYSQNYIETNGISFDRVKESKFVLGLSQASSRHMWELLNEKPTTDDRLTKSLVSNDGDSIQLGWFEKANALALYWSDFIHSNCVKDILTFGYRLGIKQVTFVYFEAYDSLFHGFECQSISESIEIYRNIS